MSPIVRKIPCRRNDGTRCNQFLTREWLVANGLGGYASGTIAGVATRRYHGLLIAALTVPRGRMLLLSHVSEAITLPDGRMVEISTPQPAADLIETGGADELVEFRLEDGLPVWVFDVEGHVIERRVLMPHHQNSTYIRYVLQNSDEALGLILRPMMHFRGHDDSVATPLPKRVSVSACENRYEFEAGENFPILRMKLVGDDQSFTVKRLDVHEILYQIERHRGYDYEGPLWSPGYYSARLRRGEDVTLIASTELWDTVESLTPAEAWETEHVRRQTLISHARPEAREGVAAELVLAADQFVILPAGRSADAAWAHAKGDEIRTVIAGYHWFTDWGRDTMISMEGLTLTTGRPAEAGFLLRTFAHYVKDGLIPNLFPEGDQGGLYHTADGTLWFFHALQRYLEVTGDWETVETLIPTFRSIVEHHLRGTRFNIKVDPDDGLLRQGEEGYQLTWMDAKVDDWVVTPRRGKAVELNALWYNALRVLEGWLKQAGDDAAAAEVAEHAGRTHRSFNERFWYEEGGYLYDVVDGEDGTDDPACRPNQIFAISLTHPVLEQSRWKPVLETVQERLLTPLGLRSLAPGHPDYRAQYSGDLRARDAAYHQGTVWGWLIGPFIDAWLRVRPERAEEATAFLEGFTDHLSDACIGQISEIFDAEAPYTPRGCVAQAWSIAEVLRCWVKIAEQSR